MESQSCLSLTVFLPLLLILISLSPAISSSNSRANKAYVIKACHNTTSYSSQCVKSLSPHANKIKSDPKRLCNYAISNALADARAAKSRALKAAKTEGLSASDKAVLRDCADTIGDTVDELRNCAAALRKVKGSMSAEANAGTLDDVRTWASASLTDDYTCTDEMDEEKVGQAKLGKFRASLVKVNASTRILLALITYTTSTSS